MNVSIPMPEEIRQAVRDAAPRPVFLVDQQTANEYVILPLGEFVRLCQEAAPDGFTEEEQKWLIVQAGLRAGWDDPAMDVYNDLDPRSKK
ncbi:MAG: hypothetical protein SH850_06725 [Planctomycetaceae bacterium]|nr:hypothetical protein [Planctomycetaceae bacterium]